MAEKKDNVSAKFKDNVFCMLYADKANLLDLYNALNNSSYKNVDDLQVTTLNGGSYMKYKNDASFLLSMNLYMFEQQSSKNPNMPLRFLHYVSDVMRQIFSNSTLHRRSMLKIPVPHFITFYNGKEKWIEKEEIIKLSDMFEEYTDNPEMELKVRVININDDAESREFYCEVIVDEANKMNKMVKRLLSLNQLEFGNDQVHLEHFDLRGVVDSVLHSTDILFKQKNVELSYQPSDEPVMVWADEYMIEEVVTNYISNALNHVEFDNKIEIKMSWEEGKVHNQDDPGERTRPCICLQYRNSDPGGGYSETVEQILQGR